MYWQAANCNHHNHTSQFSLSMEFITTTQQQEYAAETVLSVSNVDAASRGNLASSYVERDGEGNVIGLVDLGQETSTITGKDTEPIIHWDMPDEIGELQNLQKLAVYNCRSLPPSIGNLSQLRELSLHFCSQMRSLPAEIANLYNLQDVRIHGDTAMNRIIPRLRTLPNLRFLYYRSINGMDKFMLRENLVGDLLDPYVRFKDTLEILDIEGGDLLAEDVADLFSKVLPQYPNLQRVFIPNNLIRSLTPILKVQPKVIPPTVRLRQLNLLGNPVLNRTFLEKEDLSMEQANLLKLVTLHEELVNLGRGITESDLCTTETLLMLDLNEGGRVLLSKRFRPIPLSVWPIVLERASLLQGYHPNTNILYHLLRHGPAWGKRDLGSNNRNKAMKNTTLIGKKRKSEET
jgi:Leucine-rich repeat (LRR) protein